MSLSVSHFSLLETAMDSCKILLATMFVVTLSSVTRTAPLNSPPNRVEILISLGLSPILTTATKEVRNTMIFQCNFYLVSTERAVSSQFKFSGRWESRECFSLLYVVTLFLFEPLFLQMKSVYPFIASNTDLQSTMLLVGAVVTPICSANLVCNFSQCHFVWDKVLYVRCDLRYNQTLPFI